MATHDPHSGAGPAGAAEAPEEAPAARQPEEDAGLAAELARVSAERAEYLDALQRLKAEFDNYRKRTERDRQQASQAAVAGLVRELLPVVDNLERAVGALGEDGASIAAGVEMVRVQLADLLAARGVSEIPAHGAAFDPTVHEAVATHPTADHPEGTVIEVVQKGYTHGDAVIRPVRVVVAERPADG